MHVQVCTLDRCCEYQRTHLLDARYKVCICTMYTHVYMHMYMYIYIHVYACIYTYMYVFLYVYMCASLLSSPKFQPHHTHSRQPPPATPTHPPGHKHTNPTPDAKTLRAEIKPYKTPSPPNQTKTATIPSLPTSLPPLTLLGNSSVTTKAMIPLPLPNCPHKCAPISQLTNECGRRGTYNGNPILE